MGGDTTILDVLGEQETIFMSIFVLGELIDGFKCGKMEKKNQDILKKFLEKPGVKILPATYETSEVFGTLKSQLKKAGTPIPINDVWIAAHALETGSVLMTFDRHFQKVPGLRIRY